MHKVKIIFLTLFLPILLSLLYPANVFSASRAKKDSYSTFGIQPAKIEFNGSGSGQRTAEILVINFSNHPIKVKAFLSDFIFTNDPKQLYVFAENNDLPVS